MKLLLTLLAILTGFAGGDAARFAPAPTATLGVAAVLAKGAVPQNQAQAANRPVLAAPLRLVTSCTQMVRQVTAAPILSGLTPRGLRARE